MLAKIRDYLNVYATDENITVFDGLCLREMVYLICLMAYYRHPDKSLLRVARYMISTFDEKLRIRELCINQADEVLAEKLILIIETEITRLNPREQYIERLSLDLYNKHCYK